MENQQAQLDLETALLECEGCVRPWVAPGTMISYRAPFRKWLASGWCEIGKNKDSSVSEWKLIDPLLFRACLDQWIKNDVIGRTFKKDFSFNTLKEMIGYKFQVNIIELRGQLIDGLDLLDDFERITDTVGPEKTYMNWPSFRIIESYRGYDTDQIKGLGLSAFCIICVVFFVTVNLKVTLLVVISVVLVDFFLIGLIHFWNLTLNLFTGINLIFALGIAVDFSTHIAHSFLLAEPPASCETD